MSDIKENVSVKCPHCGGSVKTEAETETVVCPFCETTLNVSELLGESDAVKIEKMKAKAAMDAEIKRSEQAEKATEAKKMNKVLLVSIIGFAVSLIFSLVGFSNSRILSGIIAVIMTLCFAAAIVFSFGSFKENKKTVKIICVVIGIVLLVPYFLTQKVKPVPTYNWADIVMNDMIPDPENNSGKILFNDDENLSLDLEKVSESDYKKYLDKCKDFGYTVDADTDISDWYTAFNEDGYELSLRFSKSSGSLSINLDAPMKMSEITWPSSGPATVVPTPDSLFANVTIDSSDEYVVYIGKTDKTAYGAYVDKCMAGGFNVDYDKGDDYFTAENTNGYSLRIDCEGANVIRISIEVPEVEDTTASTTENPSKDNVIRDSFKKAVDEYEKFIDEYIDVTTKYNANPSDTELMMKYTQYLTDYTKAVLEFEELGDEELTDEELAYYVEVQARITQKLLTIS